MRRLVPLLLAVVLAVSCTDAPTDPQPVPAPEAGLLGALLNGTGLLQCHNPRTATASALIGPNGGTLAVGDHRLAVPAGALPHPTLITATAPRGQVNLVEFEPHGLAFRHPAQLTMSYANCGLVGGLLPGHIAYVDGQLDILELLAGLANPFRRTISTDLDHFSGYAIAW